jgi:hypothetical protein
MECLVKDGKDSITLNNTSKYCYEHYQIYDSLTKLYAEVSKSHTSLSWNDFLAKVLDADYKQGWKTPLVDSSTGKTLETFANVAKAELNAK